MIRIKEEQSIITMHARAEISQGQIIRFLQSQGYEVKGYYLNLPAQEGLLVSEPAVSRWTFTATKEGEKQSNENIYTNVFEREIKDFFKTFSKI
jgi:hypothetical protein|nr:MAG TPA: hypothetical protein [Caudoviricetes sp.]